MSPSTSPASPVLRSHLGLPGAVALGVGGTVGGGIFVLVGVAARSAGPGALLAFGLGFALVALVALPYTELAGRRPGAGGGYAFTQAVLGRRWGFAMGWGYLGAWLLGSGYVTAGFGEYLRALVGLPAAVGAIALIAACASLNVLGLRPSARAQFAVLSVALVGLVGFVAWGAPNARLERLTPLLPEGVDGLLFATVLAFLSLNGFDAITAAAEEIHDPARTIPRAIRVTLLAVGTLYVAVAFVALGTLPLNVLSTAGAPLADAARAFGGDPAWLALVLTAVLATAATANAMVVVSSRIAFAMARDRHLPAALAGTTATGAPATAVLGCAAAMALVAVVALAGQIALIAGVSGLLYVLHYLPPLAGLIVERRRVPDLPAAAFATPAPRLVIPLAIAACVVVAASTGPTPLALGAAWLAVGGLCTLAVRSPDGHTREAWRSPSDQRRPGGSADDQGR